MNELEGFNYCYEVTVTYSNAAILILFFFQTLENSFNINDKMLFVFFCVYLVRLNNIYSSDAANIFHEVIFNVCASCEQTSFSCMTKGHI